MKGKKEISWGATHLDIHCVLEGVQRKEIIVFVLCNLWKSNLPPVIRYESGSHRLGIARRPCVIREAADWQRSLRSTTTCTISRCAQ
jgi:hypothetical protein